MWILKDWRYLHHPSQQSPIELLFLPQPVVSQTDTEVRLGNTVVTIMGPDAVRCVYGGYDAESWSWWADVIRSQYRCLKDEDIGMFTNDEATTVTFKDASGCRHAFVLEIRRNSNTVTSVTYYKNCFHCIVITGHSFSGVVQDALSSGEHWFSIVKGKSVGDTIQLNALCGTWSRSLENAHSVNVMDLTGETLYVFVNIHPKKATWMMETCERRLMSRYAFDAHADDHENWFPIFIQ